MGEDVRMATCYVCRRRKRGAGPGQDEITYQVWLRVETHPAEDTDDLPESMLDPLFDDWSAEDLRDHLKEALAMGLADRAEDMVWKTADDLSEHQAADIVATLPDSMKALIAQPVESMATAVGAPLPVAALGGDVGATLVLRPVLEPVEKTVHGLEVIGIIVGLATGLHPLAIVCAKHLAHDKLGSVLAAGFKRLVETPEAFKLNMEISAVSTPADQAQMPRKAPLDRSTADHQTAGLRKNVIPAVCGIIGRENEVITGNGAILSKAAAELLREAEEKMNGPIIASAAKAEPVAAIDSSFRALG